MPPISREALIRLARTGATARVKELQAELETIFQAFPDLRPGRSARQRNEAVAPAKRAARAQRPWSAAARKAVSDRMKKYWAARRAKTAKKG